MNKVYLVFPLIGILIFGGFYLNFHKSDEAKLVAIKTKAEDAKKAKAKQQVTDRTVAIEQAVKAQAAQKILREEKERQDEAKKVARQEAEDFRQRTYDDRNKFRDQVTRLKKDLTEIKEASAKVADEKKHLLDENVFLKTYVGQANANVKYYYDLLEKINAAEKAAEQAASAAAALAKKG
jgi:hypothetical protein